MIFEWAGNVLVILGVAFSLIGSLGLNRLPDFYTRAHAATKPDTLGLILTMLGLSLRQGFDVSSGKMILIVVFVACANPAAAHALGRSAMRAGLEPWMERAEESKP